MTYHLVPFYRCICEECADLLELAGTLPVDAFDQASRRGWRHCRSGWYCRACHAVSKTRRKWAGANAKELLP